MPLPAESLTPESDPQTIRDAISQSIAKCIEEGQGDQKQCAAIAYEMARKSTGQELGKEG
jgi:hypothetical protein